MSLDIQPIVDVAARVVDRHALGAPGRYRRFADDARCDPYGVADAANLLYTMARLPGRGAHREGMVQALRDLQGLDGLWRESTHHPIHTTAHCVAALELFDARPARPLDALAPLREPAAMERFLDELAWVDDPWRASHQGAGLYSALVLAGEVDVAWQERWLAWIEREWDADSGLLREGAVHPDDADDPGVWDDVAGTFHYLFCFEHARRAPPHPEALIDTCLRVFEDSLWPFSLEVGFAEIDWVYCVHRASRRTTHRFDDVRDALRRFADRHVAFLTGFDEDGFDDLHTLFGAVCALAELQAALPGYLRSERPLRLVLDRRPFI